jgi:uncharacterized protein YbjT (DUF2867 family)
MKVVVIGGSGLIGTKLVDKLRRSGHDVLSASLNSGVNILTGEGLDKALAGAQVVVNVANSPSFEEKAVMDFFETSGRKIHAAEKAAGVKHHVALSIVGTGRLPDNGYFRAKVAQENLIKASKTPYTIVHATQFFEFLGGIIQSATEGDTIRLPAAAFQPLSAEDVADAMHDATIAAPINGMIETAGPDRLPFTEFARMFLAHRRDPRKLVADPKARYFGAELNDQSLVPGDRPRLGRIRFADWIKSQPTS